MIANKKLLRVVFGAVLALSFGWLVVRRIHFSELQTAVAGISVPYILLGLLAFVTGYIFRIERWRIMLGAERGGVKWRDCSGPLLAGFALNNLLPFRAGDMLRSFAFNGKFGMSASAVLATLFVERLMDLVCLLILLCIILMVYGMDGLHLVGISWPLLMIPLGLVLGLLVAPRFLIPLLHIGGEWLSRISPGLGRAIQSATIKGASMLTYLCKPLVLNKLLLWSFSVWLMEASMFWFVSLSLPSLDVPSASLFAMPIGTLATLIPSTPGYVGTFDYFVAQSMIIKGNTIPSGSAYALLVHAVLWLPVTFVGGIYVLMHASTRPRKS